jgi:hypothetical protein
MRIGATGSFGRPFASGRALGRRSGDEFVQQTGVEETERELDDGNE